MIDPAAATYRALIDHLAGLARGNVFADRIRGHGHAERTNGRDHPLDADEARRSAALLAMTDEQRDAVAELLELARTGAIHDVVAVLDAFGVTIGGKPLPELADEEPKFDFLDRFEQSQDWR